MFAECDLLRDDGERYAERLEDAGVSTTFSLQLGHIHGSAPFTKVMESVRAWRAEVLEVLRRGAPARRRLLSASLPHRIWSAPLTDA